MRSRFAALELQLVGIERRVHVLELRCAALKLQLVALGLRLTAPAVQLGGVELRFERGIPVLELRYVALERQLVILELRFATFEFWFTTPKKRAGFRPGSGRLRDWTGSTFLGTSAPGDARSGDGARLAFGCMTYVKFTQAGAELFA
jgi:hypothetical protein